MSADKLVPILSRLVGRDVDADTTVKLSSVQQGAFASMAAKAGASVDRGRIKRPFTVATLLDGAPPLPVVAGAPETRAIAQPAAPVGGGVRLGCDVQSIEEFARGVHADDFKTCPFLTAHFAMSEISYCENQLDAMASLCGLYAAKEAIVKAGDERSLNRIVIDHYASGQPGCEGYALSISHSGDVCMAVAFRGPA